MQPYPAAVTCLARPIGCVDLLLDILRVVGRRGILFGLDDFDVVAEGRVIVCFSLHRRLYFSLSSAFATTFTHGVCRQLD